MGPEYRVLIPESAHRVTRRLDFQRPLWTFLQEGGQQALRLRIEGRSQAKGKPPRWLKDASIVEFQGYGDRPGELVFTSPAIEEVLDWKGYGSIFPSPFTPQDTALSLLEGSLLDAVQLHKDSEGLDDGILASFHDHLKPLLGEVDRLEFKNGRGLLIGPEAFSAFSQLKREMPARQWCRVTGKLEAIFHGSHGFILDFRDGKRVRGIVDEDLVKQLPENWGKWVSIEGQAVFRPSGNVQRIEAHHLAPANEDEGIWSVLPQPLFPDFDEKVLHQPQGPKSGLAAIIGQWPGDESDLEVRTALEALA